MLVAMTENPHPAIVARRRRLHQIRVRIAAAAVGVFIAVFSVIWAQLPATASTTNAQDSNASSASGDTSSATSASSSPTPMTTSQS